MLDSSVRLPLNVACWDLASVFPAGSLDAVPMIPRTPKHAVHKEYGPATRVDLVLGPVGGVFGVSK